VRATIATVALLGSLLAGNLGAVHAEDGTLFAPTPPPAGASQLTLPNPIWLPGAAPGSGHLWVGDSALTFCRLDGPPNATFGTLSPNASTCDTTALAPSQAVYDARANPDGTHYVYIADDSTRSQGAVRVTFDPTTETIVHGSGIVLGDGGTAGRTNSIALNRDDGKLYVAHVRGGSVMRITNPNLDSSQQFTEIVGRTSDGRGVRGGMSFVCGTKAGSCDLYIGEFGGNGVTVIPDAQSCNPFGFGGCAALPTSITTNLPGGLTSDGNQLIFVGDSPRTNTGTILRYNVFTDQQDILSSKVPAYSATYPVTANVTTYTGITGIAVDPAGNVYVGDDPTLGAVAPPRFLGRVWKLPSAYASVVLCNGTTVTTACVDALGAPGVPAQITPPPSLAKPATLVAWGQTSPHGMAWMPGQLGGHLWIADHTQGLCRLDKAPDHPELFATNPTACDTMGTIGSPGQPVYDVAPNADGTHFVYVPDQAVKSPGLWRLTFNTATETIANPVLMAPGAGLDNDKLDGVAMGPDGNLYAGGLKNGFIYRIQNPHGDPLAMAVDIIGTTTDNRGINGTIGFLGNDLYLPENKGAGVITNAVGCALANTNFVPCQSKLIKIPTVIFASSVATDPKTGVVYVAVASGPANGTIYRYQPSTGTSVVYATQAQLPTGYSPTYVEDCTQTCQRGMDSNIPANGVVGFHFPLGMVVDGAGNLLIGDDPMAGVRGFHGHVFSVPFTP
jgi:hypothetical protein